MNNAPWLRGWLIYSLWLGCTVAIGGTIREASEHAMELQPSDWVSLASGLGGAIIGAVIGGAISLALARQASQETLRRDQEQRIATEKTAFIQLLLKAQHIANSTHSIMAIVSEAEELASQTGTELWQTISPVTGQSKEYPSFDVSDLTVLILASRADLIDRANLAAQRYISMATSFEQFSEMKMLYHSRLAPYTKGLDPKTNLAQMAYPAQMAGEVNLMQMQMKTLINHLRDYGVRDVKDNAALCEELGKLGREYFNDPKFLSLRAGEEEQQPTPATTS